ncbi:unnamed protein product [Ixodes hexagonus]
MILRPLLAVVRRGDTPLSAEIPVEIVCEAVGSRPPAAITWWRNGVQLNQTFNHVSADGNESTSVVNFTPTSADNGLQLMCRAQNPLLPGAVAEDVWVMRIYYKPLLSVDLGPSYRNSTLIEGTDVFLECKSRANPPVADVGWRRDGAVLVPSGGPRDPLVNDNFLAIQKMSRHDSGNYSCFAGNSEGVSESGWFDLRVQYAPVCKQDSPVVYVGSRSDEVQVVCEVLSHPDLVTFHWSFNGTGGARVLHSGFSGDRATLSSVMRYTPLSDVDFGTLLCLANNSIGYQSKPCVFHIVQARPRCELESCRACSETPNSVTLMVTCSSSRRCSSCFALFSMADGISLGVEMTDCAFSFRVILNSPGSQPAPSSRSLHSSMMLSGVSFFALIPLAKLQSSLLSR